MSTGNKVAINGVSLRCEVAKTEVERFRTMIGKELIKELSVATDAAWQLSRPGTYLGPHGTRLVFHDDPNADDCLHCTLHIGRSFLTHTKPGRDFLLLSRLVRQQRMRCNGISMLICSECIDLHEIAWLATHPRHVLVGSSGYLLNEIFSWTCQKKGLDIMEIIIKCGNEKSRVAFRTDGISQVVNARFIANNDQSWPILSSGFRLADQELVLQSMLQVLDLHIDFRCERERLTWWHKFRSSSFELTRPEAIRSR